MEIFRDGELGVNPVEDSMLVLNEAVS